MSTPPSHPIEPERRATIGALINLRRSQLVVIHDAWVGYSHHAPIVASYELRRGTRGDLNGGGRFSTAVAGERVVDVTITPTATARFLNALASASVAPGAYEPLLQHTDDYPHLEIALHVGAQDLGEASGVALLFTKSQGRFNAPWGGCVGGQVFTVPGEEIGRALAALRRPLQRAMLDRMVRGG